MWKIIEINMNTNREYIDVIAIWDEMMIFRNDSFGMVVMVVSSEITIKKRIYI